MFQERLNEINYNINEFKDIFENISYDFYKARFHLKSSNEMIEKFIDNFKLH